MALTRDLEKPTIGVYYPSLLPSRLLRQYRIYREGIAVSLEKSGVFKIGELLHDFLSGALKSDGTLTCEFEKPIVLAVKHGESWIRISGRVDAVLSVNGENVVLEVKSISKLPGKSLEHHVMQIQPYLLALNNQRGLIVYLEKHRLSWRIFEVPFDGKLMDSILKRAKTLHESLTSKNPPKPERSWECKYCEFGSKCEESKLGPSSPPPSSKVLLKK